MGRRLERLPAVHAGGEGGESLGAVRSDSRPCLEGLTVFGLAGPCMKSSARIFRPCDGLSSTCASRGSGGGERLRGWPLQFSRDPRLRGTDSEHGTSRTECECEVFRGFWHQVLVQFDRWCR